MAFSPQVSGSWAPLASIKHPLYIIYSGALPHRRLVSEEEYSLERLVCLPSFGLVETLPGAGIHLDWDRSCSPSPSRDLFLGEISKGRPYTDGVASVG